MELRRVGAGTALFCFGLLGGALAWSGGSARSGQAAVLWLAPAVAVCVQLLLRPSGVLWTAGLAMALAVPVVAALQDPLWPVNVMAAGFLQVLTVASVRAVQRLQQRVPGFVRW